MSWGDAKQIAAGMQPGGKQLITLCMKKTFGIADCPHCIAANQMYSDAREQGGSKLKDMEEAAGRIYFKKLYMACGIVTFPGKPQHGQIVLFQMPMKQVERVIASVTSADADTRWPDPAALATGRPLVLRKFKKDAKFSDYDITISNEPQAIDPNWWAQIIPSIPDFSNPAEVMNALNGWDFEKNQFWPKRHMQNDDRVRLRLLPHKQGENLTPFAQLFIHYIEAETKWDIAWKEVGYDVNREAEVRAKLNPGGVAGAAPAFPGGGGHFPCNVSGMDDVPFA